MSDSSSSFPAKQSSSNSIPIYNVFFALNAESRCGHDACGGGSGGGGVSLLHTGLCIIGAFDSAGFISSSGNCCPLKQKTQVHRPYLWSTLKCKRQFASISKGLCNACIGNIEGFPFVYLVLPFQDQAESTKLSSFLNHLILYSCLDFFFGVFST